MNPDENTSLESFQFEEFVLNPRTRTLFRSRQRITIQSRAFDTLAVLVERHGQVVGKETLLGLVWPETAVEENNLAQSVAAVRRALGDHAADPRFVATIPGKGYSFIAAVHRVESDPPKRKVVTTQRIAIAAGLVGLGALVAIGFAQWRDWGGEQLRLTALTGASGAEFNPTFSPDGRAVVYAWKDEGEVYPSLYLKIIGAGEPLRLTHAPSYTPAWSPDGRHIAYYKYRNGDEPPGYYVMPAIGGAERLILGTDLPANFQGTRFLDWFPDGERIAVLEDDAETGSRSVFEVSITTGKRRRLIPEAGAPSLRNPVAAWSPAVSPDGEWLLFRMDKASAVYSMNVVRVGGGEPREITPPGERATSGAWTADGREIVYPARTDGIYTLRRVEVTGGRSEPILQAGYDTYDPAVSRMGNRLAFVRRSSAADLMKLDLGSTRRAERIVAAARTQTSPQFSPDGRKIAFASNHGGWEEIWVSDDQGHNLTQITSFGSEGLVGTPRWSPGGEEIAFDGRKGNNCDIYVVNVAGGAPGRLTKDPAEDILPSYSRDGKWIYFASDRSGTFQIWRTPRQGGVATQVTRNGGVGPLESGDGRFVYYFQPEKREVWRIPTTGGAEEAVVRNVAAWQQGTWRMYYGWWTVSGNAVFYFDEQKEGARTRWVLNRLDPGTAVTSVPAQIDARPLTPGGSIAVSPDGRTAVLVQATATVSQIMLLENFR